MNATQLLEHFDRLVEAPNAVPRLRRFILDLAVRGKLVEQDPGDVPAGELMKQIRSGKAKRIKSGEVRNPRDLTFPECEAPPFLLPPLWNWVRLADVGAIVGGGTPPAADADNFTEGGKGIGWLTPADLGKHKGLFVSHGVRDLTAAGLKAGSATLMPKGSVLFTSRAPIGYVAIAANEISTNQGFKSVVPYLDECSRYIATYLQAFGPQIDSQATGTTFKEVSGKIVSGLPLPLPPLAEQHRIVAKVDELMTLCDQLEAAQQERERRRDRLTAASLQRVNQPAVDATPETQREYARFHLHHLPRLTTRPAHIKAMRQTILNIAVRGRLVPREAGDESAATLLSSIASTRSKLVKAGVIRKTADLAPLSPEDTVFQVPGGWVWERLGTVGYTQTGTTPPTSMPECFGGDTPFVTPSDLTASVTTYRGKGLTEIGVKHSRLIAKNSVLMVCIGSTIGKVNVVDREVCCNQQINTVTPVIDGMTRYVAIALRSDYFQELVVANAGMGTLPILSKGKWEQLPMPIPPLAEQQRIVAKVDELMALCDQLEAQLTTTQTDSRRLLEAVLEAALAPV